MNKHICTSTKPFIEKKRKEEKLEF